MENWKDIIGYEGLYQVSDAGNVKSLFRYKCQLKKVSSKGYFLIALHKNIKQKSARVHRLVAETFIPNPENKSQVNHINGIKTDNRVENLEWVTPQENTIHAIINGLKKTGSKSSRAKLSSNEVFLIRQEYMPNIVSLNFLAKKYAVSKKAILLIIQNKTYKYETSII